MQMLMFLHESLFWLWLTKAQQQNLQLVKYCRYHNGLYNRLQGQDNYHLWLHFIGTWFQKREKHCIRQQDKRTAYIFLFCIKYTSNIYCIKVWQLEKKKMKLNENLRSLICIYLSKIHCFYNTKYKNAYYDLVQWFKWFLQICVGPIVFNDKYILSFYLTCYEWACK